VRHPTRAAAAAGAPVYLGGVPAGRTRGAGRGPAATRRGVHKNQRGTGGVPYPCTLNMTSDPSNPERSTHKYKPFTLDPSPYALTLNPEP